MLVRYVMENLKRFEDLGKPDPRFQRFHTLDKTLGGYKPLTLRDFHATASEFNLNPDVPEDVQSQINVALNMWVYSWYHYPMNVEAGFLAFRALENALRYALNENHSAQGLKRIVQIAIERRMLKEDGFTRDELPEEVKQFLIEKYGDDYKENPNTFMEDLPDHIASLRNSYAHGEYSVHMYGMKHIRLVIEAINQLYPLAGGHG